jgi:MFS family permease
VTSILISFIIKYTGRYKYLVTLGALVYLTGLILMFSHNGERLSSAVLIACQVPIGVGGSMIHLPAQIGIQASANHSEMAAATALFLTLLEVGGAVGAAISGAIWSNNLLPKLREYLPDRAKDRAESIYSDVRVASMGWAFGTPERTAINQAYQETFRIILIVGICVALPLIPLSLLMEDYRLDKVSALHPARNRSTLGQVSDRSKQMHLGHERASEAASELEDTADEGVSDTSHEWDESGVQRRRSRS